MARPTWRARRPRTGPGPDPARRVGAIDSPSRACDPGEVPAALDPRLAAGPAWRPLVATWALAVGALLGARLAAGLDPTGFVAANLGGIAAFLFVWLPDRRLLASGEAWASFGVPFHGLGDRRTWSAALRGAWQGLAACAIVFPPFVAAFWGFAVALPRLPRGLAALLAPYAGAPHPGLRFPPGLASLAVVQLLVVALPEELFYRGWVQTSWRRAGRSPGVRILGASLGEGFVWTQLLFAAGHLVTLQPWRLGTFFPGLLFGWLRERTGSIAAPVVVHALSNLLLLTLERSFYG